MATIGITGGTGFVGTALSQSLLQAGHNIIIFTRKPGRGTDTRISQAHWDPSKGMIDPQALESLDACIHLAGAGVADKRWTASRKKEILESRTVGTSFLVDALRRSAPNCKALVSASAIGYYGPDAPGKSPFTEQSGPGNDFLADTCTKWEAAAAPAASFLRLSIIRIGIVLGRGGGALPEFQKSLPFRVKAILGSGKQMVSWIHLADLVGIITKAATDESWSGVYNAVGPAPVSNRQLMDALARARGGFYLPVSIPAPALKLAFGEMSIEILKSCTVRPDRSTTEGYTFQYPTIDAAAGNLLGRP